MSRAFSTHFANRIIGRLGHLRDLKLQATSGSRTTAEYHFSSLRAANGRNTPSATGAVFEISGNRVIRSCFERRGFHHRVKVMEL